MRNQDKTSQEQFEMKTGLKIGKFIDEGVHGRVYAIKGQPNKVVKIVHDYNCLAKDMGKLIKYLKRTKNSSVVKIHQFGQLYDKEFYYYIMERLLPLKRKTDRISGNDIADYLCGDPIPGRELSKVKNFIKKARKLKYDYADCHTDNIMKNKRGSLKFVDLESFVAY